MSEKENIQILLDEGLVFAEKMLLEYGEFHPFGWAMKPNTEVSSVAVDMGSEFPPEQEHIDTFFRIFAEQGELGIWMATAIFYDVFVTLPGTKIKSDAIAVALDDANGYSSVVFKPYKLVENKLVYKDSFAIKGANKVFPRPN